MEQQRLDCTPRKWENFPYVVVCFCPTLLGKVCDGCKPINDRLAVHQHASPNKTGD